MVNPNGKLNTSHKLQCGITQVNLLSPYVGSWCITTLEAFEPQALLCTDINYTAAQILSWFVVRWQLDVTFEEVRAHLGMETQRQ